MEQEKEYIENFEVREDGIIVFSNREIYNYSVTLFLCEIFEKLESHFNEEASINEFFNYEDPHGAYVLLSDYFNKTDFLRNASIHDFEEFRSRYDIALDYKIGENSLMYDSFDNPSTIAAMKTFNRKLDRWRVFDKSRYDDAGFDPSVFRYYSCSNMINFVFALVHYLIYNGYKITNCAHCGKLFATKNLKEKYCCRNSPFPGYERYNCKEAVDRLKDALEKRRTTENERLRQKATEYGIFSTHAKVFNDFSSTCDRYKAQLKKGASVTLLEEYQSFLYDSAAVRPKYKRIKNW